VDIAGIWISPWGVQERSNGAVSKYAIGHIELSYAVPEPEVLYGFAKITVPADLVSS